MRTILKIFLLGCLIAACSQPGGKQPDTSGNRTDSDSVTRNHDTVPQHQPVIDSAPQIRQLAANNCTLHIPSAIRKSLEKYDGSFSAWQQKDYVKSCDGRTDYYRCSEKQLPFAITADFNSDGKTDLVINGHNQHNNLLLGIVSSDSGYVVTEIRRTELILPRDSWIDNRENRGLYHCLEYVSKDDPILKRKKITISADAFSLGVFGKGATLYYYKEGAFRSSPFTD